MSSPRAITFIAKLIHRDSQASNHPTLHSRAFPVHRQHFLFFPQTIKSVSKLNIQLKPPILCLRLDIFLSRDERAVSLDRTTLAAWALGASVFSLVLGLSTWRLVIPPCHITRSRLLATWLSRLLSPSSSSAIHTNAAQHNNAQSLNTSNFESIVFFFEFPGAIHTNAQHKHPYNPENLGPSSSSS
ncbi:hypothetical protein C8R45DRAFT_1209866 [Mycena sanguinolenta]|nr:hypothetical protein C8R45DRAFT_1209866 [Mycena sanguinolenta]